MAERAALHLAFELLHAPWRVRTVREQPLPDGVALLLSIAAGDPAGDEAIAASGRPPEVARRAAGFFIEQVLLAPGADAYRVLGTTAAASSGELRRNMALLMRWLHPDVAREGDPAVFAARIAAAWNALKATERRAAYDRDRQRAGLAGERGAARARASPGALHDAAHATGRFRRRPGALPRVLAFLLGRHRY